jgi:hypothetical protein
MGDRACEPHRDSGDLRDQSSVSAIDRRSTSSSRASGRSPRGSGQAGFHANVVKYVDFESPILKHLIDIEQKFWSSETNQGFRMPRIAVLDDSEASVHSLEGVAAYDLASQNEKRPPSTRILSDGTAWSVPAHQFGYTEARSCDGKTQRAQPKDSSEEIDTKKYFRTNGSDSSQGKKSLGKLESKIATKLRIRQLCQDALKKDIIIGTKTPMVKRKQEKAQKLFLKKSTINSKANSPPRIHTSTKDCFRKSGVKESSRRGVNRKDGGFATRLDITDKTKYPYLKLESSEVNHKKTFLKKFNSLLKKGSGNSYMKDLREKSSRKLEEDRRKSQADLLSHSKMFSKLLHLPTTSSKQDRAKVSSRELLTKISSDILGKQNNIFQKFKADFDCRGSASKSQHFSFNLMNSHLLRTPKDTKGPNALGFKSKPAPTTASQTRPSSKKQSQRPKKEKREPSPALIAKKRTKSPGTKAAKPLGLSTGAALLDKTRNRSGERKKADDRLRKTDIDSHMVSSALKHKIWNKLTSKSKQAVPSY